MIRFSSLALAGLVALAAFAPAQAANISITGPGPVGASPISPLISGDTLAGKAENRGHVRSRGFGRSRFGHRGFRSHRGFGLHRNSHRGLSGFKHKTFRKHHRGLDRHFRSKFKHHGKYGHSRFNRDNVFRHR
ncbi:hypothetical protein SAMN02745824_3389 [Parasphingorhabdus marina DSM 22363]|uniref:Uncharacterized protein n=1 Tax=Parasphingorhabdus marina DSM 22363 TaxID=1123272 RepID=A0A1N6HP88_9SPHN|nr:hypothetical protein SAMN02745824_3389 [Parasphingorhabdus marina DSM 22363]